MKNIKEVCFDKTDIHIVIVCTLVNNITTIKIFALDQINGFYE